MFSDTGEDVGQPSLGIDVVQLGRDDEAVEDGGALAAAIGAGEQPGLSSQSQAAQRPLGSVVRQADPAVVEEAGEGVPTLQHVIHGDRDVGMARQLAAFLAHPRFKCGDQRRSTFPANGEPAIGRQPVDGALDLEQGVDPPDGFEGDGRDGRSGAALGLAAGIGLDIGEHEELAPGMGPARRLGDRARLSPGVVQLAVAAIGVGLQDAGPGGEMLPWMPARAVARVEEHGGRRRATAERLIVTHIGPTSPGHGLALGQHRHRRVVAMQPLGSQDVGHKAIMEWPQHGAAGAYLIGQRRQAQGYALAGVALGLAVERLMLAVLLEQDHGQQAGPRPASGHDVERRRRLLDGLAVAARELLAHMLDHFPLAGNDLQSLGDVLAQLRQACATTAGAGRWAGHDQPLARQVFGEGLARRTPACEGRHRGGPGRGLLGRQLVFGRRSFQLLELQLELVEQAGAAFGALAEAVAPQLLDVQLEVDDQGLVIGGLGPQGGRFSGCSRNLPARHGKLLFARQHKPLQALRVVRQGIDRCHGGDRRAQTRRLVVNSMRADSIRRTGVCEAKRLISLLSLAAMCVGDGASRSLRASTQAARA